MKKRIPILLTAVIILQASTFVWGQQKEPLPPEDRAAKLTEWMNANLQLTEDQTAKAQDINLKYARKNETLRNSNESRMEKIKKLKSYDQEKDDELKALFNADQYKIYSQKKEEIKEEVKMEARERKKG